MDCPMQTEGDKISIRIGKNLHFFIFKPPDGCKNVISDFCYKNLFSAVAGR